MSPSSGRANILQWDAVTDSVLKVAFSPIYKYQLPDGHRFPMIKYELLPEQLLYEGTLQEENFFHPEALSENRILATHTQAYWDALNNLPLERKLERAIGFPVRDDLVQRGRHIAQGTIDCARYAMQHGVALNVAGGTHHAFADHGEGFCVFNDFAIASHALLDDSPIQRILIIDLDVHQGNGTAKIFEDDPRVFTWSMHGAKNYPVRKQKSDLDIGLPDDCEDDLYLKTLEDHLEATIDMVSPDLIFYLSGVDVLKTDKLGRLALTKEGCKERDRKVLEACHRHQIPVAISMGGGYSEDIRDIVEAHANTFRLAQEIYF